jgi:hypothetical protein
LDVSIGFGFTANSFLTGLVFSLVFELSRDVASGEVLGKNWEHG